MIYIPLLVYETGFHGAQNRSDSPSNYDPEGLILLSPPLQSSDDRCALPHPDWDSHEQFLSSQATDGEWCTALIQRHLMSIVFHVFTFPFCSCCGRGCITPLFSRTELALSVPFSVYLLVSVVSAPVWGVCESHFYSCWIRLLHWDHVSIGNEGLFLETEGIRASQAGEDETFAFRTIADAPAENATDVPTLTPQSLCHRCHSRPSGGMFWEFNPVTAPGEHKAR